MRGEPGGGAGGDTLLDVLGARRDQQHVEHVRIFLRRTDHFEVEADFLHREGDVLVGLHLDLTFELVLAQGARHLDHFRDRSVAADRDGGVFGARAGALHGALDRIADGVRVDDCFLVDRVRRSRFGGVRLDAVLAAAHAELDQLHRGGGDVQSEERSGFCG